MVANFAKEGSWDVLLLSRPRDREKTRVPGVARVEVSARGNLDKQKPHGRKKARVVDRGIEPAELSIEIELLPEELNDLYGIMNLLRPRRGTAAQEYLLIHHPAAAFYGINEVVIGDIGSPHPEPGGTFFFRFTAVEHVAKPKAVKPPAAAAQDDGSFSNEGLDALTGALRRPSQAVQDNFTAPEDVVRFENLGFPFPLP